LKGYVLDASVAAKWVLDSEAHKEQADALYDAHCDGAVFFTAPDFFWFEIANVLWKAARRRRLSKSQATSDLIKLEQSVSISTVSSVALREDALTIALEYNCAVYDAGYLALAMNSGLPMITADERLVRSLAARFPVQWIGALGAVSS
jgi:predicted nucleic acid-binding protein